MHRWRRQVESHLFNGPKATANLTPGKECIHQLPAGRGLSMYCTRMQRAYRTIAAQRMSARRRHGGIGAIAMAASAAFGCRPLLDNATAPVQLDRRQMHVSIQDMVFCNFKRCVVIKSSTSSECRYERSSVDLWQLAISCLVASQ